MKELSIEEKAKAYDEALERAKKVIYNPDASSIWKDWLKNTFSELKESEDERIKQSIIADIKSRLKNCTHTLDNYYKEQLAWLEKQGEPKDYNSIDPHFGKPIDKVEPKFKVGDWITNGDYTWKIVEVMPLDYILQSQDGNVVDDTISHVDEQFHSLTIEDAKDGDILQLGNVTEIFQEYIDKNNCKCYCSVCNGEFEIPEQNDDNIYGCFYATPAIKEQCDILMNSMTDAGYTFDFKKKELKKIELIDKYEGLTDFERILADICVGWIGEEPGWKQYIKDNADALLKIAFEKFNSVQDTPFEQKPANLEEFINELSKQFPDVSFAKLSRIAVRVAKWAKPTDEEMKELLRTEYEKGRADVIAERQKPTWNEEDERAIGIIKIALEHPYDMEGKWDRKFTLDWLESLKERIGG